MLKFSTYEVKWPDIASVVISGEDTHEVSVVTTSDESLVVGIYPTAADAATIKGLIDLGKVASSIGGTTIVIDIDDF